MRGGEEFTRPDDCNDCGGETRRTWMGTWVRDCRSCQTVTLGILIRVKGDDA